MGLPKGFANNLDGLPKPSAVATNAPLPLINSSRLEGLTIASRMRSSYANSRRADSRPAL
jgi:hypothetical protein